MNSKQQPTALNILLADDDKDDRFLFDKALKEIPISTCLTTVHHGEQLMDYLSENSEHLPDVLFLDLNMPRKTGFECLTEIKENKKLKDLPVIMFSTSFTHGINYEQDMINMLLRTGAHHFIRKPSDFAQLKQVIHDALIKVTEKRSPNG
jgi:CheY-like chemotaxis protein